MGFKRSVGDTFTTPVTVKVPNDRGGFDTSDYVPKFKRPTDSERPELAALSASDLCRRQMVGWTMKDADTGEEVPFSHENLEAALQILPTPLATVQAFWDSVNGARTKN